MSRKNPHVGLTMEHIGTPTYILVPHHYDFVNMIYYLNEYEYVGYRPDTDTPVYKHRQMVKLTHTEILEYHVYEIPYLVEFEKYRG